MIGQRVGKYRLERLLGEGGMGVVYEAVRTDIGGRAAVKLLRPGLALHPDTSARFFNEARAANIIDHPGIVKVIDYGHLPTGEAYLAMEFLDGESLFQRLVRERRLSEADTLRLGRQIAAALAAAHAKQIVHRDLKPENVFIVPDSEATGGERAKILDFGIAKLTREHQGSVRTQTNALMGTPIYMSPEQCRGKKDITDRTDVYALGTMLYELLAGRPPFIAEDPGEYISLHMYQMPTPLSQLAPYAAPALHRLIDSMLAKEPTVRPAMSVVARMLKDLGNLSSDVLSVRALSEGSDGETQPLLRALSLVKPGGPAAPPAPSSELKGVPGVGSAPPPPSSSIERAARNQPPVDVFDRTEPQPPRPLPPRPVSALDPPTIHDPSPPRPEPPQSTPPRPQQDSTRQFDRAAMPTPAGQVGEAAWQQLAVMPGASAVSPKLDADSGIVDPRADRRGKSIGRRLRRLRFKLKRRLYGWLGIPISDKRNTPPGTSNPRATLMVGSGVIMALGVLIFFALRPAPRPVVPVPAPGPVTPEPPTPAPSPTPPAPPPPVPQLPDGLAAALSKAREKAFAHDMSGALKVASNAAKTYKHPEAWRAMGEFACMLRKVSKANDARTALIDDGSDDAKLQLKQMLEVCRAHFVIEQDGKLIVSADGR